MADVIIPAEAAFALARDALAASRTAMANAQSVARALVEAELDGLGSHGLSRVPSYAEQAMAGKVDGHAFPALTQVSASVARVDARCGFAYPALAMALEAARAMAQAGGIGAVAVTNSHHCGVAGHHVSWLASRGLVGLLLSNTPGGMAPWGGSKPSLGTNPIAFAAPREGGKAPMVVDLSLSKVARGRVLVARQKGEPIPPDWALDEDGHATTDPEAALRGTMTPMGDAKGAALALMVEILTATLTGSQHAYEASSFLDAKGSAPRVGQLVIAFSPAAFGADAFASRIEDLLGHILGQAGTRLPGDKRAQTRERRMRDGIPVDAALVADIRRRAAAT